MNDFELQYKKVQKLYAKRQYKKAITILKKMPEDIVIPENYQWMYYKAYAMALFFGGYTEESLMYQRKAIDYAKDASIEEQRILYSNYCMYSHYLSDLTDEQLRDIHFGYDQLFRDIVPYQHTKQQHKGEKLRIGYLSPDIVDHIVLNFAIQLFSAYHKDRYEVYLYSIGERRNEVTEWVESMVDVARDLKGLSAAAAAKAVYDDKVDILFDLAGHTEGGRTLQIEAYKPAPVQICGIGYFNTTGLKTMDYFLSDIYCDTSIGETLFSETLVQLPHSHFCFTPSERFQHCQRTYVSHEPVVFGSFNNFSKVSDLTLATWKRLSDRVPGAKLLLKNVAPQLEPLVVMRKRAERFGFTEDRLELRPGSADYLDDYMDIDIALDTFPYPGGGTTCEALLRGVPVITLYGERHGSRFGYSLLKNIGIAELAAASVDEYIEKAAALAADQDLLTALHQQLPLMMRQSPVMDAANYVREIETAYDMMWQKWLNS